MNADVDGKITYRKFKKYFTSVPEDDLKRRVSTMGGMYSSPDAMKKFER